MTGKLLSLIPPHKIYVEPYGGAAYLLINKEPSPVEIYNDVHSGLVALFRVLRDKEKFDRFYNLLQLTPYSEEEFYHCKLAWQEEADEVEKAYKFFVCTRMSFNSKGRTFAYSHSASVRGMAKATSAWLSVIDQLPELTERLRTIQVEYVDGLKCIQRHDDESAFMYLDPPYPDESRRELRAYKYEMDVSQHEKLLDFIKRGKSKFLVSSYSSEMYDTALSGWNTTTFEVQLRATNQRVNEEGQRRMEKLWWNYDLPDVKEGGL
jgi:DNA adenine methylase